jgi:hypothetical protein
MDSKKDRITHGQALRLEKLCQAVKGEGSPAPHLNIHYAAMSIRKKDGSPDKVVWETSLSVDNFVARSEPWRGEDWVSKNAQEAFAKLCQEVVDSARHEVSKIDAQVNALKKKRDTISRSVDDFVANGGWKAG